MDENRVFLKARDDQQFAAYKDCADEMQALAEAAQVAGNALNTHGLPFHMVISQLTGVVASALYQAALRDWHEQHGIEPRSEQGATQ